VFASAALWVQLAAAHAPPDRPDGAGARQVEAHLKVRARGLPESERIGLAAVILDEAARARLDPLFILAIIEVESGFDPEALSDRGARGLMQLLPSTLHHEASRWRLPAGDPTDPVLNVRTGVRYYQRLLRAFKSHELALMAYNAGPSRIRGYLKAGPVPDRFRGYPRRVRAELRRIRQRAAPEPARAAGSVAPRASRRSDHGPGAPAAKAGRGPGLELQHRPDVDGERLRQGGRVGGARRGFR
jgi:soluble lytic murein transglycosylase-like protein